MAEWGGNASNYAVRVMIVDVTVAYLGERDPVVGWPFAGVARPWRDSHERVTSGAGVSGSRHQECASTPKIPQVMDRQSPAPTRGQFGRPSWPRGASRLGLSRAPSSRSQ